MQVLVIWVSSLGMRHYLVLCVTQIPTSFGWEKRERYSTPISPPPGSSCSGEDDAPMSLSQVTGYSATLVARIDEACRL